MLPLNVTRVKIRAIDVASRITNFASDSIGLFIVAELCDVCMRYNKKRNE